MIRFLISVLYFIFVSTGVFAQALNKQSYVKYGESYLSQPWHALSRQSFARFKTDGNRVEYEGQVFERRRHLAALAMAEIIEGKGRFIDEIVVGIDSMMREPWWGIPAHCTWHGTEGRLPPAILSIVPKVESINLSCTFLGGIKVKHFEKDCIVLFLVV